MDTQDAPALGPSEAAVAARLQEVDDFAAQQGISLNKKKRKALSTLSAGSFEAYKLSVVVATSCKALDLERAYAAYLASKGSGVTPSQDTFYNLLSLTAGLGDQGSSLAPPRQVEPPQNIEAACVVFADMKAASIKMCESTYTAMIRCCSMNGREHEALALYREMRLLGLVPKLRSFGPLLACFAKLGRDDVCFELFAAVSDFGLLPTEREYLSMLRLLILLSDDRFYSVLDQMMEDVLVPSVEAWAVLRQWFSPERGFECIEADVEEDGRVLLPAPHSETTQQQPIILRSVDIDAQTKSTLLLQIESLACSRQQGAQALPSSGSEAGAGAEGQEEEEAKLSPAAAAAAAAAAEAAREKWGRFKEWLAAYWTDPALDHTNTNTNTDANTDADTNTNTNSSSAVPRVLKQAPNVVVDGANCGYYKQNYAGAPSHVDYRQIDWMVRQLQQRGLRPLLVLHSRHLHTSSLPSEFAGIVAAWRAESLLLETPPRCNDDWFWLYTAVALDCRVVTNDEMRDHHFQMLAPRFFSRWKERRQVHFSFGQWVHAQQQQQQQGQHPASASVPLGPQGSSSALSHGYREALLEEPRRYSHRMQCLSPRAAFAFPAQGQGDRWLLALGVDGSAGSNKRGRGVELDGGKEGKGVEHSQGQGDHKKRG